MSFLPSTLSPPARESLPLTPAFFHFQPSPSELNIVFMKPRLVVLALCLFATLLCHAAETNDIVLADFESETFGEWKAIGDAFGGGPAHGTLTNQQPVTDFLGRGYVNSFHDGDQSTGTLTSAEFTIIKPYLNFLIGGGNHPGETCINLVVDGQVVKSATGTEFERLHWHSWQLFPWLKKKARLEIIDQHTGGWGHIHIDQIILSDRPKVYPAPNDAITSALASLAESEPRARQDPNRPIFHFLAPANWMNDPNGPIYANRYYHLYYQLNPYGDGWGHMHWGHARSRDLVFWKHLPIALWPSKEKGEDHVFSGAMTTNGTGQPLAFYTSIGHGKSASDYAEQWAAMGDDQLNVFEKQPANPILSEKLHGDIKVYDWRDPFIFRESGTTFMVCGGNLNRAKGGEAVVTLYRAENDELSQWKYLGVLFKHPDASVKNIECPNFFKLDHRWVLIISPHGLVEYFTGAFDPAAGKFTAERRGLMDYGDNFYAPNSLEDPQGRRVLWGWVRGFKSGRGWNGCLTLPRLLTLRADGLLRQEPAPELGKIREQVFGGADIRLHNATNYVENLRTDTLEIEARFDLGDAKQLGLLVRCSADGKQSVPIVFDGGQLDVAGAKANLALEKEEKLLKLRVFLDKSVLEVYANDRACFTRVMNSGPRDFGVGLFAAGGTATLRSFQAWPMKTIWRE
jgi:beta-fructofuranosidase